MHARAAFGAPWPGGPGARRGSTTRIVRAAAGATASDAVGGRSPTPGKAPSGTRARRDHSCSHRRWTEKASTVVVRIAAETMHSRKGDVEHLARRHVVEDEFLSVVVSAQRP